MDSVENEPQQADAPVADQNASDNQDSEERQKMVPLHEVKKEREKRRRFERQVEELTEQVHRLTAAQARQEDPDFSEEELLSDLPGSIRKLRDQMGKRFDEALRNERIGISDEMARYAYEDYDDAIEQFKDMVREDPSLLERFQKSRAPAQFLYKTVKSKPQKRDLDSIIEERVMAELEKRSAKANLPKSVSTARGTGSVSGEYVPMTLEEMLRASKKR